MKSCNFTFDNNVDPEQGSTAFPFSISRSCPSALLLCSAPPSNLIDIIISSCGKSSITNWSIHFDGIESDRLPTWTCLMCNKKRLKPPWTTQFFCAMPQVNALVSSVTFALRFVSWSIWKGVPFFPFPVNCSLLRRYLPLITDNEQQQ